MQVRRAFAACFSIVLCIFAAVTELPSLHPAHADTKADDLNQQIAEWRAAGNTAQAVPLAQEALALAVDRDGRDSSAVASALITLAEFYVEQGRKAEAEPLFRRALDILKSTDAGADQIAVVEERLQALDGSHGVVPAQNARRRARRNFAQQRSEQPEAPPQEAQPRTTAGVETAWDVVPVFYGTDRAETPHDRRPAYSAERGHRLDLGRALVTVPKSHQVPNVERPWALHIPYFDVAIYEEAEDPKKHFTLQEVKRLAQSDFLALVRERLLASSRFKDHAIIFVHGYNTSFDNALYRTAQIAYDMQFDGAPFVYSWPSGGAVTSYTYDRESAEGAEPHLRKFIELVVKETGAATVSIIAHSMGNQALLNVLREMNSPPPGVLISQLILAAPDVDTDNFANLASKIGGLSLGVTLYASSNGRALIASRSFWGHSRAGDVPAAGPVVLPSIETIDVTAASTDIFALNHSGYAQNSVLLTDMGKLIESSTHPPDVRFEKIKPVSSPKGDYWRYVP